jgi:tetraacyldisaccharide 4'-kinase
MDGGMYGWLQRAWYERAPGYRLLIPLSLLYGAVIALRRALYRLGVFRTERLPVPVVVVGNIVAGGAGKTPVTLFLARAMSAAGFRPGIVSRGYGRTDDRDVVTVTASSRAAEVGDEPLLLARRAGCPVVVGRDRVAAGHRLVEQGVDVVIADDGLQHYRLGRDVEICVVDGDRRLGNGWLLPAGPLREPRGRLETVDMVVVNGGSAAPKGSTDMPGVPGSAVTLVADSAVRLDGTARRPLADFRGEPVHAIAGIGNPRRFFALLESHGLEVVPHPLPDHVAPDPAAIAGYRDGEVLMTEKDAVKLQPSDAPGAWYVPVELEMEEAARQRLVETVVTLCRRGRE